MARFSSVIVASQMRVALVCFIGFWVLVSIGGVANTGYRQYLEYLSTLSADGAEAPNWGTAAFLVLALGYLALVPTLFAWRRFVGAAVAVAALAMVGVALLRVTCPLGARFCQPDPVTGTDVLHGAAVLLHVVAILAALLVAAGAIVHGSGHRMSEFPAIAVSVATAIVASSYLLTVRGIPQRIWLLAVQALVLLVAACAAEELHRLRRVRMRIALSAAGDTVNSGFARQGAEAAGKIAL